MEQYIIRTILGFLSHGGNFCQEYPDAEIFPSRIAAIKAWKKTGLSLNPGNAKLYKDYGFDTETEEEI